MVHGGDYPSLAGRSAECSNLFPFVDEDSFLRFEVSN
jgi:hypothetical protein